MNKEELIKVVSERTTDGEGSDEFRRTHGRDPSSNQEMFYANNARRMGYGKHDQEELNGVSRVGMTVTLLNAWLQSLGLGDDYENLPAADRREIWEASDMKEMGIMHYDDEEVDFYWRKYAGEPR